MGKEQRDRMVQLVDFQMWRTWPTEVHALVQGHRQCDSWTLDSSAAVPSASHPLGANISEPLETLCLPLVCVLWHV